MASKTVETIVCDIICGRSSFERGIKNCKSKREVMELINELDRCGLLSEFEYEETMSRFIKCIK